MKRPPTPPTDTAVIPTPPTDTAGIGGEDEPVDNDEDEIQRIADWDERVGIPVILNKRKNIDIEFGWNQVVTSLARYDTGTN